MKIPLHFSDKCEVVHTFLYKMTKTLLTETRAHVHEKNKR